MEGLPSFSPASWIETGKQAYKMLVFLIYYTEAKKLLWKKKKFQQLMWIKHEFFLWLKTMVKFLYLLLLFCIFKKRHYCSCDGPSPHVSRFQIISEIRLLAFDYVRIILSIQLLSGRCLETPKGSNGSTELLSKTAVRFTLTWKKSHWSKSNFLLSTPHQAVQIVLLLIITLVRQVIIICSTLKLFLVSASFSTKGHFIFLLEPQILILEHDSSVLKCECIHIK